MEGQWQKDRMKIAINCFSVFQLIFIATLATSVTFIFDAVNENQSRCLKITTLSR